MIPLLREGRFTTPSTNPGSVRRTWSVMSSDFRAAGSAVVGQGLGAEYEDRVVLFVTAFSDICGRLRRFGRS